MPNIQFKNVTKKYGALTAIEAFSAEVPDKEFLVLLGPSGCGKSTMLRLIAGLTEITSGNLEFDGKVVNMLEPKERNVAFVFQSYALYPHLSVRANIAFPLLMNQFRWYHHLPLVNLWMWRRALRDPEINSQVMHVAEMMELTEYLDRRPRTLSGGQRQRVALGRALIRNPTMYLLDEPLSNLDAVLRSQMRAEITALYHRVRKSFIFVTHDQVEAMTMGTRIIVLNRGVVQQYGTPKDIYDRPANTFVAKFIGSPPMNLMRCLVGDGNVHFPDVGALRLPADVLVKESTSEMLIGVRAEKISILATDAGADGTLAANIAAVEYLGAETIIAFNLGAASPDAREGDKVATRNTFQARMPGEICFPVGAPCRVQLDLRGASFFDGASGDRIATNTTKSQARQALQDAT